MLKRFFIILLLFSPPLTIYGFELNNNRFQVTFPFKLYNNLVIIQAILNDQEPLNLILDTGTRSIVLFEKKLIKKLRLNYGREVEFSGVGNGQKVKGKVVHNLTLDLPGIHGDGLSAVVTHFDYLDLKDKNSRIDGIIGYELFMKFIVKIDYPNRTITFFKPENFVKRINDHIIPIQIRDTKPFVESTIYLNDQTPLRKKLLIDTGSSLNLLMAHTHGQEYSETPLTLGKGFGGMIVGYRSSVAMVRIKNWQLNKTPAIMSITSKKNLEVFDHGIIGGNILKDYCVTFNYFGEEMHIGHEEIPKSYVTAN